MKFLSQIWRKVLTVCVIVWMITASAYAGIGGEYVGVIGKDMKIHMNLERQGEEITGWYYYDTYQIKLSLQGKMIDENNFCLVEYDQNGNQTGMFQGVSVEGRLEGKWMNPDQSVSYHFRAVRL